MTEEALKEVDAEEITGMLGTICHAMVGFMVHNLISLNIKAITTPRAQDLNHLKDTLVDV